MTAPDGAREVRGDEAATSTTARRRLLRARRLSEAPAIMVAGRFGAMALAFLPAPVIARALGPEGRGITASALAVLAVLPVVLGFGVALAVRRRLALEDDRRAELVRTARRFVALTFLPATALAVPVQLLLLPGVDPPTRAAFYLSMALLPLTVGWSVDINVLLARDEYRRVAAMSVSQGGVSAAIVLAASAVGMLGVPAVLYAFLAGNVATFALGRAWVRSEPVRPSGLRALAREGSTLAGGQLADVLGRRLDQVLAMPLMGFYGAGIYSVAVTVGSLGAPVVEALGQSVFRNLAGGDRQDVVRALRYGASLSFVTGAALMAASWIAVPTVFGPNFAESRAVALVTVAGGSVSGLASVAAMALAAQQLGRQMTIARVAGVLVGVGLLIPGALLWGPVGAAVAMATGALVSLLVLLRRLGVSLRQVAPRPGDLIASTRLLISVS